MRVAAVSVLVPVILVLLSSAAFASSTDTSDPTNALSHTDIGLNLLWVVIGAVPLIFMQGVFALVETGFCRAKHAAHVVSTNFAIFGLGFVAFYTVGFPIMFSGFSYAPFGMSSPLSTDSLIHFGNSGNWVF